MKQDIRQLSLVEISEFLQLSNEPSYRASQVYEWIWQKHATSFGEMTNVSKKLREQLEKHFCFYHLKIETIQVSIDKTVKMMFTTWDGFNIESVLIPTDSRRTACISSQVGCSLNCSFCATGKLKRERNLSFAEIIDQIFYLEKYALDTYDKLLSNIVFMGMGEPLLNYTDVLKSINLITDPSMKAMSPSRITLSTAGIANAITRLGDDKVRFELAVSLHATNDNKRNEIMSINQHNNIAKLTQSINYFHEKTKSKITLEYILLSDFNDSLEDAKGLIKLYRKMPIKLINIIEYNPIDLSEFSKPDEKTIDTFMQQLKRSRVNAKIRRSRGKDIDAACGQLASKHKLAKAIRNKTIE